MIEVNPGQKLDRYAQPMTSSSDTFHSKLKPNIHESQQSMTMPFTTKNRKIIEHSIPWGSSKKVISSARNKIHESVKTGLRPITQTLSEVILEVYGRPPKGEFSFLPSQSSHSHKAVEADDLYLGFSLVAPSTGRNRLLTEATGRTGNKRSLTQISAIFYDKGGFHSVSFRTMTDNLSYLDIMNRPSFDQYLKILKRISVRYESGRVNEPSVMILPKTLSKRKNTIYDFIMEWDWEGVSGSRNAPQFLINWIDIVYEAFLLFPIFEYFESVLLGKRHECVVRAGKEFDEKIKILGNYTRRSIRSLIEKVLNDIGQDAYLVKGMGDKRVRSMYEKELALFLQNECGLQFISDRDIKPKEIKADEFVYEPKNWYPNFPNSTPDFGTRNLMIEVDGGRRPRIIEYKKRRKRLKPLIVLDARVPLKKFIETNRIELEKIKNSLN